MTNTSTEHSLSGDLRQMSIMDEQLRRAGFSVGRRGVYPTVSEDQFEAVLRYLFDNRIEGWWNQERALIERGICTQRDFDVTLGRVPREGSIVVHMASSRALVRRRVLSYNQARMLMGQGKITMSAATSTFVIFTLKPSASWQDVNHACMTWPMWSKGKWDVSYGEGPQHDGEVAVYAQTGEGDNTALRTVAVTCLEGDLFATSVSHLSADESWHNGMEECVANAQLSAHAPSMLETLMMLSSTTMIRDWLAATDPMAFKQLEDTINSALDAVAGPQ